MSERQSPEQEAVSLISIGALLVAAVLFLGADRQTLVVTDIVMGASGMVYRAFPMLALLKGPQIPVLVGALAIGGGAFFIGLAFKRPIANWFSQGEMETLERQTERLKRNRAKMMKARRDKDTFDVS